MEFIKRCLYQLNPYHMVPESPWPFFESFSLLSLTVSAVMYMHGYPYGGLNLILGLILTVYCMGLWFRDVITESTFEGFHTKEVVTGIILGFLLFIVSEVFAFLSVFWAYFHSALSPTVEIGGCWPPQGINPLNAFAIPLTNTILLLSSGSFITYAHHALLKGDRKISIFGTLITILLAIIFTGFQGYEYFQAPYTIADSVYGSAFFASTGLHGFRRVPTNFLTFLYNNKASIKSNCNHYSRKSSEAAPTPLAPQPGAAGPASQPSSPASPAVRSAEKEEERIFLYSEGGKKNKFFIGKSFLLWLSGFVDAEGNFNISLRNFDEATLKYNSLVLTFQIGLHVKDLPILKLIQQNLHCGHISVSGDKCNFFVNDQDSLINIIIPIFKFVNLNSSKKFHFEIFKKAVNLLINKKHLTIQGKSAMIDLFFEMKKPVVSKSEEIVITDQWFAGFVDGDGCFSFNSSTGPRFKLENHIKEYELYIKIKEYLHNKLNINFSDSIVINTFKARANRVNSNPVCVIDIHNIHLLKNLTISIFKLKDNKTGLMVNSLMTKKLQDFNDWCILVNIFYYGYNQIFESIPIINEIRLSWNNFRLQDLTLPTTPPAREDFNNSIIQQIKPLKCKEQKEGELKTHGFMDNNELKKLLDIAGISRGIEFKIKLSYLFNIPSPYIIKDGIRFLRGSNSLVSPSPPTFTARQAREKRYLLYKCFN